MMIEWAANHSIKKQTRFEQAWATVLNDLEARIAAHSLARQQDTPKRILY
jgi:hypothetical protein